jgi:hypothetical protein
MSEKPEWEKKKIKEFQDEIEAKNKGVKTLNITVDPTPLENAMKKQAEAEAKAEEYREKLELVTEAQAEKLLNDMGITDPEKRFELKANPEMLIVYKQAYEDQQKNSGKGGSGSAPLNQAQITGGSPSKHGYNSTNELIDDLTRRSHEGGADGKEADRILQTLLSKAVQGVKEGRQGFGKIQTPIDGESELERLKRIQREKNAKLAEGQ